MSDAARDIVYDVTVDAPIDRVWAAISDADAMRAWMGEPEMDIRVETDWRVGGTFTITGHHHARIVNRGALLRLEPLRALSYTSLSSISRLPDVPESYTTTTLELSPEGEATKVTVTLSGFPTESIEKHQAFYWRGTLVVLKRWVEEHRAT